MQGEEHAKSMQERTQEADRRIREWRERRRNERTRTQTEEYQRWEKIIASKHQESPEALMMWYAKKKTTVAPGAIARSALMIAVVYLVLLGAFLLAMLSAIDASWFEADAETVAYLTRPEAVLSYKVGTWIALVFLALTYATPLAAIMFENRIERMHVLVIEQIMRDHGYMK